MRSDGEIWRQTASGGGGSSLLVQEVISSSNPLALTLGQDNHILAKISLNSVC